LPKDSPIYDYFSSYVSFEFGEKEKNMENNIIEDDGTIKFI
jgi:hypothetical protein